MPSLPSARTRTLASGLDGRLVAACAVVGFAALTALAARISVPLPGTPVPVTLQTLAVTLAALTLGARLGAASMALYAGVGLLGAPVFSDGSAGFGVLFGATGGYLAGFIIAQPLAAAAVRPPAMGWRALLAAVVVANAAIFACGVAWLKVRLACPWDEAMAMGLWPFLPGALVKSGLALAAGAPLVAFGRSRGWHAAR